MKKKIKEFCKNLLKGKIIKRILANANRLPPRISVTCDRTILEPYLPPDSPLEYYTRFLSALKDALPPCPITKYLSAVTLICIMSFGATTRLIVLLLRTCLLCSKIVLITFLKPLSCLEHLNFTLTIRPRIHIRSAVCFAVFS